MAEEPVVRVSLQALPRSGTRLLIRAREHQEPMQGFDGPSVFDEAMGEPVEQLGMRRRFAQPAEITRRANEALPEVMLPKTVDQDAGRQGMIRGGQPTGQFKPTASRKGFGGIPAGEHRGEGARNRFAGSQVVSPDSKPHILEAGMR